MQAPGSWFVGVGGDPARENPMFMGVDGDPTREYAQQLTLRIPGSSVMKASFVSLTNSFQLKEIKGMRRSALTS
ncbi:hypothetical protein PENFLA_c016G09858 [Penicillium flavigenum]|uniref:Uncharacterized protein n=1 Tax=Penicillium flavigenum TaxID=254877 RepID=A0A1V6T454_9EURO|nr:hypothetical protein PENFLA_c016G09858 [Penicillium flavigenum]